MSATKDKHRSVVLSEDEATRLIDALGVCEELLSLLEGPVNGEYNGSVSQLIAFVQDYAIVSARIPLALKIRAANDLNSRNRAVNQKKQRS
jgi:hypothetical protein